MDFNIMITYEPGLDNSNWVFSQINSCIGTSYVIVKVKSSIILLNVQDPYVFWQEIKRCLQGKDTPIHRVIPVDKVTEPLIDSVAKIAKDYALHRIPESETYRITLHGNLYTVNEYGRLVKIHSIDAVRYIAQYINRRVNLKNPQWVVYVRSLSVKRWQTIAIVSVARAFVFKNIRIGEMGPPI